MSVSGSLYVTHVVWTTPYIMVHWVHTGMCSWSEQNHNVSFECHNKKFDRSWDVITLLNVLGKNDGPIFLYDIYDSNPTWRMWVLHMCAIVIKQ